MCVFPISVTSSFRSVQETVPRWSLLFVYLFVCCLYGGTGVEWLSLEIRQTKTMRL